ncbi:MAG: Ig-like domain-containing protein, partial [Candidatus Wallbacteria bacterium]|nr:Ig-like domain-containing protein [Candidatus Wallbacteria bacterium]
MRISRICFLSVLPVIVLLTGCFLSSESSNGGIPDNTVPSMSSAMASPADDGTGAAINGSINATFSEEMNSATINTTTFTLKQGATTVPCSVTYVGTTATLHPISNLAATTVYTATITTGARDLAGNALASDVTWNFTTGSDGDSTPPTLSSTVSAMYAPADFDAGVALNGSITATFSEGMNPATINTTTFTLKTGITSVSCAVKYAGTVATLTPTYNLIANTTYTATITTGAMDLAGNAFAVNTSWNFTTGTSLDSTVPTVSSTIPANAATAVAVNGNITATFSEGMDPSTITTATFTLKQGSTPVPCEVTYLGFIATLNPTSDLAANTIYTAMITTVARDLSNNAMTVVKTWSFTTGSAADSTAPTVSSTIPANAATAVAVNGNITATFSEGMDPTTITTTTFTLKQGSTPVTCEVTYLGIIATLNPTGDLAANSMFSATITVRAKDLAGNALTVAKTWNFTTGSAADNIAPTVSSTSPTNAATAVAVNGNITATFSEGMDPATITTATFTLKQGTTPVTCEVTYLGYIATLAPISDLAFNTTYTATISTLAKDLAHNALAAAKTWNFTTGIAPDNTAPTVSSTSPANAAIAVAVNGNITATFSEGMDPATITTTTFTLMQGITPVTCEVTYHGYIATLTPAGDLSFNTPYTATISTAAKDQAHNALAVAKTWSFTTGAAPDNTAPTVSSTSPTNAATSVAVNGNVTATFSEGMDPSTITTTTFTLLQGTTPVTCEVTYHGYIATLTPAGDLAFNTPYTATISTAAKDQAHNALAVKKTWSFTTGAAPDNTAPTVSSTSPANAAIAVAVNGNITATFSEGMDPSTITTATFILKQGTTPVTCEVTYTGTTATLNPASDLAFNTIYTAEISTAAKDQAHNALAVKKTWSFTTGAAPDNTAPTVSSTSPANAAIAVAVNGNITATFSEGMDPSTITTATFTLKQGSTLVTCEVTYTGTTATLNPASDLAFNTTYTAEITTAAKDQAHNALAVKKTWSFTTGAAPDNTAPTVSSTSPANAATAVAVNGNITATFSEGMDPSTITTATFTLKQGTTPVTCEVTY